MSNVMVVEDDGLVRLTLVMALEDAGHDVLEFAQADTAKIYFDDHADAVDAVVTDIEMPGQIDGLKLAWHIADKRPGVNILVTSGRKTLPEPSPDNVAFLQKPWQPSQVLDALELA